MYIFLGIKPQWEGNPLCSLAPQMHTCPSLPGTEYRSCSQSLRTSPVHTPEKRPMPGKEERERTKGRLPLTSNRALPTQDSHWSFKLQVYFIYVASATYKCCKDKFTAFTVNTHALNKHFLLLNNLLLLWMSHIKQILYKYVYIESVLKNSNQSFSWWQSVLWMLWMSINDIDWWNPLCMCSWIPS